MKNMVWDQESQWSNIIIAPLETEALKRVTVADIDITHFEHQRSFSDNSYQAIVLVDPCYLESQLNPLTSTPAKTGCAARMFRVDDALSLTSPTTYIFAL